MYENDNINNGSGAMTKWISYKKILAIGVFIPAVVYAAEQLNGITFFSPRPQNVNAAREIVGWHPHIHQYNATKSYATFAIVFAYHQSVRPNRITRALFNTDTLHISGSQVVNRGPNDILADFFGLSPGFESMVFLKPLIRSVVVDTGLYIGLDSLAKGLYIRAHAPAAWTKWNLKLEEEVQNSGSVTPFPAGYMAVGELAAPIKSFKGAIKGDITFGQVQEGIAAGKIDGAQSKGGLADIHVALGWNFILRERGHAGLNVRVSGPTGSRPTGEFLFEPIVGHVKHWAFGIGFTGQVVVWEKDADQEINFFADVNIEHLFRARQRRSFDLKENGFGSRYILLKEFDQTGAFTGKVVPAINKTTLDCTVRADVQADIVLMFGYTYRGIVFDIGYNGWIRSKEKISLKDSIEEKQFGLKGIQDVFDTVTDQANNITQSNATLMGNNFVDQDAVADESSPQFISTDSLDIKSAASPLLITHKIFFHLGHAWHEWDMHEVVPFIGVGGEIEFEGINERNTAQPDKTTMGQWGIWLKGGFNY